MLADRQQDGQGDNLEAINFSFAALSDSNKSFIDARTKTVGTFSKFFEAALRALDERSKEGTDPKHC